MTVAIGRMVICFWMQVYLWVLLEPKKRQVNSFLYAGWVLYFFITEYWQVVLATMEQTKRISSFTYFLLHMLLLFLYFIYSKLVYKDIAQFIVVMNMVDAGFALCIFLSAMVRKLVCQFFSIHIGNEEQMVEQILDMIILSFLLLAGLRLNQKIRTRLKKFLEKNNLAVDICALFCILLILFNGNVRITDGPFSTNIYLQIMMGVNIVFFFIFLVLIGSDYRRERQSNNALHI